MIIKYVNIQDNLILKYYLTVTNTRPYEEL